MRRETRSKLLPNTVKASPATAPPVAKSPISRVRKSMTSSSPEDPVSSLSPGNYRCSTQHPASTAAMSVKGFRDLSTRHLSEEER